MTNIIVAFPGTENARNIKNILVRSGFSVTAACTTGAQVIGLAEDYTDGIVVCGHRLVDMLYEELFDCLPEGMRMLLLAAPQYLGERDREGIVCLPMPMKVHELVNTVGMLCQEMDRSRRKRRQTPRERGPQEVRLIKEAKELLMERNHMTETEAHRYIQKCSMDSGANMAETARMVLMINGY